MENKVTNPSKIIFSNNNDKIQNVKKIVKKSYNKSQRKKAAILKLSKIARITYYTKDLFINSCLAFVYDFVLRVLVSVVFFKAKMPQSVLQYFLDYLFVPYGFYYTIIWIVALVAFINYIWRKDKNVELFYYSWLALLGICVSQILIDLHVYLDFLHKVVTFNFGAIYNSFAKNNFQLSIFALLWSIKNIARFIYVSSSMTKIKIQISEIDEEQ